MGRRDRWWAGGGDLVSAEADTMMGVFRWTTADGVRFYELLVIRTNTVGIEPQIKHFGADLVGWEEKGETVAFDLVPLEKAEGISLRRSPDETGWMIYRLGGDDRLEIGFRVEGEESDPDDALRFTCQE